MTSQVSWAPEVPAGRAGARKVPTADDQSDVGQRHRKQYRRGGHRRPDAATAHQPAPGGGGSSHPREDQQRLLGGVVAGGQADHAHRRVSAIAGRRQRRPR